MPTPIAVACLQLGPVAGESVAARVERVIGLVGAAPPADLLVLPELWDVGYFGFDRYPAAAASLGDSAATRVARAAADDTRLVVAGSVVERDGDRLHNTIVALDGDGRVLGSYRKHHLFGYGSQETELLTPGEGAVVLDTPVGRVGLATCFDLRFPEQFADMRAQGADLFVVPAAWPAARADHWRVLVAARAIETQTPIVACNVAGVWDGTEAAGHSLVIDARGEVLADGGTSEEWVTAVVDADDTRAWRLEFPLRP